MRAVATILVVLCVIVSVSARHRLFKANSLVAGNKCEAIKGTCQEDTMQCDGEYKSGLCPGAGNIRCCAPKDDAASPTPAPTSSGSKTICLTFDDGPFEITKEISKRLFELKVPAVFFDNCHEGTSATQVQVVKEGHKIADHMCSHDIMTVKNYEISYGATKAGTDCLTTEEQQKLFRKNVMGVIEMYEQKFKPEFDAASVEVPKIKLIRFPGDGRFMKCLIGKLATEPEIKDRSLVHVGWTYEIAPKGTFGHVIESSGVDGLAATMSAPPRNLDIILAHDLHYGKGKINLLVDWVKLLQGKGYTFKLLNESGKCVA